MIATVTMCREVRDAIDLSMWETSFKDGVQVNLVLKRVYPVITQGLGWTNPDTRISPNANDHTIDVFPKYIPEGKDSEVGIVVSRRPEIIVYLYRRLDFAYESLQLEGETPHILNWDLNGTSHQSIFDPANVRDDGGFAGFALKKHFTAPV